ncbi:MAG: glycosyltransferase [Solirubrobacteraceae bacterium]|nr:glycosyltransferase [Solirubrobacteraceae bacterium]
MSRTPRPRSMQAPQPATTTTARVSRAVTLSWAIAGVAATAYYLGWLLDGDRVGFVPLFALLVIADAFNGFHALSFWATCLRRPKKRPFDVAISAARPRVDVFVPTYNEPVDIVAQTLTAARAMRGADVRVYLLDDGRRPEMAALAASLGADYLARATNAGAKSGNINHALEVTRDGGADYIAVFDCDHVPQRGFLERTLGYFDDARLGMVQTPQVYGNVGAGALTAGSSQQQEIFFGPICQGRDGFDSAFCCGTNFVVRREALDEAGGFPEDSITEDIVLSTTLVGLGWDISFLAEPLTAGLGPEDAKSYVSQQLRWATGCIDLLFKRPQVWKPLSWVQRWQYFVATSYWLSGWTIIAYLTMPVAVLLFGLQPVNADGLQFVQHFLPYFLISIVNLGRFTVGGYGISGLAMNWGSFPIHIRATVRVLTGRVGGFAVTSKEALAGSPWKPFRANIAIAVGLLVVIAIGLARTGLTAPTVNNAAFALLNGGLVVMIVGLAANQARAVRRSAAIPQAANEPRLEPLALVAERAPAEEPHTARVMAAHR